MTTGIESEWAKLPLERVTEEITARCQELDHLFAAAPSTRRRDSAYLLEMTRRVAARLDKVGISRDGILTVAAYARLALEAHDAVRAEDEVQDV